MPITLNQNKINGSPVDCTIYSLYQIIYLQYNILLSYGKIEKTVDLAIKMGVLLPGGAVFSTMYKWFTGRVKKKYGITLNVKLDYLTEKDFYNKQFYHAYGLYLIHGNKEYLAAVARGKITKEDINLIALAGGGFKHNDVYFDGNIEEVYGGVTVSMPIDVLRYGVHMGVFGINGRTLEHKDDAFHNYIYKYLMEFRTADMSGSYFTKKLTTLKSLELEAFKKAYQLKINLK